MKNRINVYLIASVVLLVALGCGKDSVADPAGSCNATTELYGKQISTFATAPTKANCEALVNTLDKIIKDCTFIGVGQREAYQTSRNEINCNDF
jgi:hypothetical protein